MAGVSAKEIPEEQRMWTDVWNWRKKYYYPEEDGEWWGNFTQEGISLGEKYGTGLCRQIVFAVLDDVNNRRNKDCC